MSLGCESGRLPASKQRPFDDIVEGDCLGQLEHFFRALDDQREGLVLDGVNVFAANDQFLPGKICAGFTNLLLSPRGAGIDGEALVQAYRGILDFVAPLKNESWGIYYACAGMFALKKSGLLAEAISPRTLSLLRERADWRRFVRPDDYTLIDLPTNYYGVAFSIARIRMLLGWEGATASEALLEKTLHHYETHSGGFGFCDDTDGEGRFDRYSILLIAEICERFIETDLPVTEKLRTLLRNSVDVVLKLANSSGDGFSFGRSLGPYGDTAMMQILTVAAYLKVLSTKEAPYAYSICAAIAEKYVAFWFNAEVHSVDMWGQGRRVDAYRGKSRILGENLSLLHQIINANRLWTQAGFHGVVPHAQEELNDWLNATQPPFSTTPFATGTYDRALAVYRDQGRVFSLPMVNGGSGQHMNSPYFPLPFSRGLIEGIADGGYVHAQLMPKITLDDGSQLIGTAYFKNIRSRSEGQTHRVSYQMDALTRLGSNTPICDDRFSSEVEYLFEPRKITRTERFSPKSAVNIQSVALDFLCFSSCRESDGSRVDFSGDLAQAFQVSGLAIVDVAALQDDPTFRSPNGPMHTHVQCVRNAFVATDPFEVQWSMYYT